MRLTATDAFSPYFAAPTRRKNIQVHPNCRPSRWPRTLRPVPELCLPASNLDRRHYASPNPSCTSSNPSHPFPSSFTPCCQLLRALSKAISHEFQNPARFIRILSKRYVGRVNTDLYRIRTCRTRGTRGCCNGNQQPRRSRGPRQRNDRCQRRRVDFFLARFRIAENVFREISNSRQNVVTNSVGQNCHVCPDSQQTGTPFLMYRDVSPPNSLQDIGSVRKVGAPEGTQRS